MGKYTIGLDYGTLSGRGIIVRCSDGKIMAEAVKAYDHAVIESTLPDGTTKLGANWCLEDPMDYIDVLEYVVPAIVKESNVSPEDIIGIGMDFTSCTMLPIDTDAVPLCCKDQYADHRNAWAKLWKHHGAQNMADQINETIEALGLQEDVRFGGKVSSELMIPKAMETLREDPEVFEAADAFLEAGDWLTRVLTGSDARSSSFAGYKMWWNREQGYPSNDIFKAFDPAMANFPEKKLRGDVVGMGDCVGKLNKEWADKLGLPEGIAVAPTIIDSHAGFAGSGAWKPSQMMLVLGTSSVLLALSKKPFSGKGVMGGVRDAVVPGYYAYESGLAAVGDLFGWFSTNCVPASYTEEAAARGIDLFALLNEKAEKLGVGETGMIALDWWNGNKTPHVNGTLSGAMIGMTLGTKSEHIYRTLVEATAFSTKAILDLYEENGADVDEIITSGGIAAKNSFVMQIYADILGKTLRVAESSQAAALGSSIYAALAAGSEQGGFDSYSDAVKQMSTLGEQVYIPDADNCEKYKKLYTLFKTYSGVMGSEHIELMRELHAMKI